jgi:hypothetical protein
VGNALPPVSDAAQQVLKGLGLTDAQIASFTAGDVVLFELPVAGTDSTIGLLQLKADVVRGGIFSIKVPSDPNAALKSFMQVRGRVLDVARAVNTPEIELIGAAVHNEKIVKMLEKQHFTRSTEVLPESLGLGPNAEADIYSKRFPVTRGAAPGTGAEPTPGATDSAKSTSSSADPTAGPREGPGRKGPAFKPQPYDPDRPNKSAGSVNGPREEPSTTAGGRVGENAPPAEHPPAAGAGEAETLAPSAVRDDFVAKLAAERGALVLKPGRYVVIGGMVYAVVLIGSVLFFINDVIAKGPIEAGKEWGVMAILTAKIAQSAGGAVAGVVGLVLFMPSDQAGAADDAAAREKLDVIDAVIHDAFEDVVGPRRVLCIGDCTPGNRHIFDTERYGRLHDKVSALMANAWEIEDDDTARRRKRTEYVTEEHRREEERDLAERARQDQELAGYRAAMHRPVGFYVHSSVGEDATNDPEDVRRVAKRLHELGFLDHPTEDLDAIGDAIYAYQGSVLHIPKPDSRIDPRGKTEAGLRAGRRISMALP